ncbi:MAG: CpaF family protein [Acidobacteria bacterium]|nr:CpaF family protein [Acidobacteriota bacterium]MBI3655977.1 CpaF family protein [Acidobacteriota bacterium]
MERITIRDDAAKRALIVNRPDGRSQTGSLRAESDSYQELKSRLHQRLLEKVPYDETLRMTSRAAVADAIYPVVEGFLLEENVPLSLLERERLLDDLVNELFGLGPLQVLMDDPSITDILVNDYRTIYFERRGKLIRSNLSFRDNQHLLMIIDRIVTAVGRRLDDNMPMVDARLPDGSRVNAIIPPLAFRGPALSIRRFGREPLSADDLLANHSLSPAMLEVLKAAVRGRLSILISGGNGTGKTTLLNMLASFIPDTERIITIEDTAELRLSREHVISLETRSANIEGQGAITPRHLVINSLRMRPDRIIVGEVRSDEAIDMLQAMNTGHEGSMGTVHANTPRDALTRLETMVGMSDLHIPQKSIRRYIASAINLVIQVSRMADGTRKIVTISEIHGLERDVIVMQPLFSFEKYGIDKDGRTIGAFHGAGTRPMFLEKLRGAGISLPPALFENVFQIR